jgi:hypothetical protein
VPEPDIVREFAETGSVQFCVQFAPVLWVQSAVKVLVDASGSTRMNWYRLGADIF